MNRPFRPYGPRPARRTPAGRFTPDLASRVKHLLGMAVKNVGGDVPVAGNSSRGVNKQTAANEQIIERRHQSPRLTGGA